MEIGGEDVVAKLKVCPVQGRQLLDVRPEDIYGDFRICNTYRGGGGYDEFPNIALKRGMVKEYNPGMQFVVQLYGCHLRCPYCYVTKDGIYGRYVEYATDDIVKKFLSARKEVDVGVLHMMGGAPALWMEQWQYVPREIGPYYLFHSDLLLTEGNYDVRVLKRIATDNALYAIGIKGVTEEDYFNNTGRPLNWNMLLSNMDKVMNSGINYYITFTNPDKDAMDKFIDMMVDRYGIEVMDDSFVIDLKDYDAVKEAGAWD
jgi:pyruvate-formate lyase-activating enzyme